LFDGTSAGFGEFSTLASKFTLKILKEISIAQAACKACGFAGYKLDPGIGKAIFWQTKLDQAWLASDLKW
jgi:hypothetical protein